MRNGLFRWLAGIPPKTVGVYCGDRGTCIAYPSASEVLVVYDPAPETAEIPVLESVIMRLEAATGQSRRQMCLSIALNSDDVFLRTMAVPQGLSDEQLGQVAIVEAVSNLPVPPEEICLDFMREAACSNSSEQVALAFCRREKIDRLLALSEDVSVPAWFVDRDIQAIHDAIQFEWPAERGLLLYPFAILLTDILPRLLICLSPVSIEVYPIGLHETALSDEITNCWTRCRLSRAIDTEQLTRIFVVGDAFNPDSSGLPELVERTGAEITHYPVGAIGKRCLGEVDPPPEIYLTALGMARRKLS